MRRSGARVTMSSAAGRNFWYTVLLVVGIIAIFYWYFWHKPSAIKTSPKDQILPRKGSAQPVLVEVYMESHCPDTTDFIRSQLYPTWQRVPEILDIKLYPYGKARTEGSGDSLRFSCQHGPPECATGRYMACVIEQLAGNPADFMPVIHCAQHRDIGSTAECSELSSKLDHKTVLECANGVPGAILLAKHGEATNALKPEMYFVPWVLVNGRRDEKALGDFLSLVCDAYAGEKPAGCKQ